MTDDLARHRSQAEHDREIAAAMIADGMTSTDVLAWSATLTRPGASETWAARGRAMRKLEGK